MSATLTITSLVSNELVVLEDYGQGTALLSVRGKSAIIALEDLRRIKNWIERFESEE